MTDNNYITIFLADGSEIIARFRGADAQCFEIEHPVKVYRDRGPMGVIVQAMPYLLFAKSQIMKIDKTRVVTFQEKLSDNAKTNYENFVKDNILDRKGASTFEDPSNFKLTDEEEAVLEAVADKILNANTTIH